MKFCSNYTHDAVTAVELKKKCRYHKKGGQSFTLDAIAPAGLCLDAFHIAYPYCLTLLYDGDFNASCHRPCDANRVIIQCPRGKMKMEVARIHLLPKTVKTLKTAAEKAFKKLFYPPDVIDYKIRIKIIEAADGCPHKPGELYYMNIRDTNELCPASFDAVYPFLGVKDIQLVHCPDHEGILYELTRRQE